MIPPRPLASSLFLPRPQPSFSSFTFAPAWERPRPRLIPALIPRHPSTSRLEQVDVSALKGMIEQVCGVPALTQRLIHRGRVLKDDQRVDNARLTDGDTILLVQRPPDAPAAPNGPTAQGTGAQGVGNVVGGVNTNGGWPDNLVHVGELRVPQGTSGAAQISQVVNAVLGRNGHGGVTTLNDFASLDEGGNVSFELTMGPNGGAPTIRRVEGSAAAAAGPSPVDFNGAAGDPAAAARSGQLPGTRAAYTNPVDVIASHVESMRRLAAELEASGDTRARRNQSSEVVMEDVQNLNDDDSAAMSTDTNMNSGAATPTTADANATEATDNTCVHAGVQCDACGVQPIAGVRFKSVREVDYDLVSDLFLFYRVLYGRLD